MKTRPSPTRYGLAASALTLALSLPARADPPRRLATGQYVTPTALRGRAAVPEPGLAATRTSSPARRCARSSARTARRWRSSRAGQNSLDKPDGTVDAANSTQFIFLYDVERRHKATPGAHAGHPAGERPRRPGLLAGRQHALRRRRQRRRGVCLHEERQRFSASPIRSGTSARRLGTRATRASASACSPTPAASASPPTARRWSSPTTTTTRSA